MQHCYKAGVCTVVLLILGYTALGQHYFLKGRVLDKNQRPIQGVTIALNERLETISGADGVFVFRNLERGRYELVFSFSHITGTTRRVLIPRDSMLQDIVMDLPVRELDEVVVRHIHSGQKKYETLQTDIVSNNFIRRNMGGSLMRSLERLPGVKSISIGSSSSKPLIRGLGFNQVVVVENGIKHEGQQWGADHGLEIDQYNINRLEIIKGPSSFMYGSDALGGAIDIKPLPRPVPHTVGGSVDITGRSNNLQYGGSFNLYGRKEKWFFEGRVSYQDYADYRVPTDTIYSYSYAVKLNKHFVRNTAGRELNTFFSSGYVSDQFSSVFSFSNAFSKSGFFANAHGLEPRNVNEKLHDASNRDLQPPYQQVSHTKIINRTEWRAGIHKFELNAGFQRNLRKEFSRYVNHGYMPPVYPSDMPYAPDEERQYDKDVWSLNIKDEIHTDRHTLTYGINTDLQQNQIGGWGFLIPAFVQYNIGGFVYDKFFLNDQLMLQGAVRYDRGGIRVKEYRDWFETEWEQNGSTTREALVRAAAFTKNFNSVTWSAGIHYNPGDLALTANIGTGFRMPIAKELAANGVNYHYFRYEKGNASLQPERSYQLDIGADWKNDNWHLRFSPYLNYFSNYIYLNPTAGYDTYYGAGNQVFNYAQAKVFRGGAEVHAGYRFFTCWHAEVAGEYVYNRQLSGDKQGYGLPFTPPASALLTLTYEPKIRTERLTETYLSADLRLTAPQSSIVPPEKKTPGYGLINMSAGSKIKYGKNVIQISLQAQNLLNKRYLNHTSFYRLIELPEMGRNIVLSVKIPFSANRNG